MAANRFICPHCVPIASLCIDDDRGTQPDEESSTYQSEDTNACIQLCDGFVVLLYVS